VRPTLFAGARNDVRVAREEIFGPHLCVIPYRNEEDALAVLGGARAAKNRKPDPALTRPERWPLDDAGPVEFSIGVSERASDADEMREERDCRWLPRGWTWTCRSAREAGKDRQPSNPLGRGEVELLQGRQRTVYSPTAPRVV
jgi:Aldehyde dehydrogenase family